MYAKKDYLTKDVQQEMAKYVGTVYETLKRRYGYDNNQEALYVGVAKEAGLRRRQERADYVFLFVGEKTAVAEALGLCQPIVRHFNFVQLAAPGGQFTDKERHVLWHEFSHAMYNHSVFSGKPMWLNEGLAEYFAFRETTKKLEDNPYYNEILERLQKSRHDDCFQGNKILSVLSPNDFTRPMYDEAWVLVRALMEANPKLLDVLYGAAFSLDASAVVVSDGVAKEITQCVSDMFCETLKSENGMVGPLLKQEIDRLSGIKPEGTEIVLKIRPRFLKFNINTRTRTSSGDSIRDSDTGTIYKAWRLFGDATWLGDDVVTAYVTAQVHDGKGKWGKEYLLCGSAGKPCQVGKGEKLPIDSLIVKYENVTRIRVRVYWTSEKGNQYISDEDCPVLGTSK
jgi:hypothetical protein